MNTIKVSNCIDCPFSKPSETNDAILVCEYNYLSKAITKKEIHCGCDCESIPIDCPIRNQQVLINIEAAPIVLKGRSTDFGNEKAKVFIDPMFELLKLIDAVLIDGNIQTELPWLIKEAHDYIGGLHAERKERERRKHAKKIRAKVNDEVGGAAIHWSDFSQQPDIKILCSQKWSTATWNPIFKKLPQNVYELDNGELITHDICKITCVNCLGKIKDE